MITLIGYNGASELAIANCGFGGSSCAKASAFAKATADRMEDKVFFDIATKWQLGDRWGWQVTPGVGLNGLNQAIQPRPAAPTCCWAMGRTGEAGL